jgi:hypothetical protein
MDTHGGEETKMKIVSGGDYDPIVLDEDSRGPNPEGYTYVCTWTLNHDNQHGNRIEVTDLAPWVFVDSDNNTSMICDVAPGQYAIGHIRVRSIADMQMTLHLYRKDKEGRTYFKVISVSGIGAVDA